MTDAVFLNKYGFHYPFYRGNVLIITPKRRPSCDRRRLLAFLGGEGKVLSKIYVSKKRPALSSNLRRFLKGVGRLNCTIGLSAGNSHPGVMGRLTRTKLVSGMTVSVGTYPSGCKGLAKVRGPSVSDVFRATSFLLRKGLSCRFEAAMMQRLRARGSFRRVTK